MRGRIGRLEAEIEQGDWRGPTGRGGGGDWVRRQRVRGRIGRLEAETGQGDWRGPRGRGGVTG